MSLHNLLLYPTMRVLRMLHILIVTVFSVFFVSDSFGQILTLTPSLSLSERYDDNIFQTDTGKESDFITIVTPGIVLQYQPTSSTLLDLDYRADFEFFAQNTGQNQIGQRGTLSFATPITPFISINISDTLIITEEPGDRRLDIDETTGLRSISQESRQQTIRNRASAILGMLLSTRTTLTLNFNSLIDDVQNPDEVDEFRYTIGAELGYLTHIRRESRLRLFYDATFHNFSANGPVMLGTAQADFQVHTINVGFSHAFSPTLSGDIAVGYAIIISDDSNVDGSTALVANLGLTKTLRDGRIAFRYRRSVTSGGGNGGEVLADIFTFTISSNLSPKIIASLGSNLSFFNFQQTGEDDRIFWTIRPELAYQLLRFWKLSLGYDFSITNFDSANRADRTDHRLIFTSQFTIRESLSLGLTYRYRVRQFSAGETEGDNEFKRNEVLLTLSYAPSFLFGR